MSAGAVGATVVAALSLALAGPVRGDERPRVVVIDAGARALAERIRAELATMGFDAVTAPLPSPDEAIEPLAEVTRWYDAVAAVFMDAGRDGVRASLYDRMRDKTVTRRIDTVGIDDAGLAVRVVELLRASLLEVGQPDAPKTAALPPPALLKAVGVQPPAVIVTSPPRQPIAAIELGLGAMASAGKLPATATLAISAGVLATQRVRAGVLALVPLTTMRHSAVEGTSETRVFVFGADVRRQVIGPTWHPVVGAGVSLSVLATEGRGAPPLYEDSRATRVAAGGYLRAAVVYDIARTLALRADAMVGAQTRSFAIDYAGRDAAHWGALWWSGWLGFESRFP